MRTRVAVAEPSVRPARGAAATGDSPRYLYPGQMLVSREDEDIVTILGSCIAVCLHDGMLRLGGMNHYLLPGGATASERTGRYGLSAIDGLVESMLAQGASPKRLVAHVVGGASVLTAYSRANHLGVRNAEVAEERLAAHGVPVVGTDVGGAHGRKLRFSPRTGRVSVALIGA